MIPQAITSSGAYANLWMNLKSMEHAMERLDKARNGFPVTDLDRSRVLAFTEFLRNQFESKATLDGDFSEALRAGGMQTLDYTLDTDLQDLLADLSSFKTWKKSLSFKDKISKLLSAPQQYLDNTKGDLVATSPLPEEFRILREILLKFLRKAETGLTI